MSYNTMENLLKPDFFNTSDDTIKTMMSTVISATLLKTTNTKLTKPVNFTLKHIREFKPDGSLSCVYWNISEWIVDGCSVLKTNSSYTVCSCVHLSTFALIMQTSRPSEVLCAVISGVLHFLHLSGFVWMFIEAVLLFICVKNLSQISSINRKVLSREFLCVIGYTVPLVVVAVSAGVDSKDNRSET
ncbi:hypothetical protein PO909_015976 [Leuciscus waleckii]